MYITSISHYHKLLDKGEASPPNTIDQHKDTKGDEH